MNQNPMWFNKIYPFFIKNKIEVIIKDDCENFYEIPKMLEIYLDKVNPIDLAKDYRKGTLLTSKSTIKNNTVKIEELWKGINNNSREKVIFDKLNRNFEQINF